LNVQAEFLTRAIRHSGVVQEEMHSGISMKSPSSRRSPCRRSASIASFVILMLLCGSRVSSQETANHAEAANSAESFTHPDAKNQRFAKAALEFTPPTWPPIDIDSAEPTLNPEVACSLPAVLQGASKHATEFSSDLDRFTAIEVIQSVEAKNSGAWDRVQTRTFDYMAVVTRPREGVAYVDESRIAKGRSEPPAIRTEGLAVTALIFHPENINDFAMICEGMGEWHGKPSWRVRFAQKQDRPANFQVIHVDDKRFGVKLKGRAWIAADNYEIEHIDVDLLEPIPQIRLLTEHSSIDYGAVGFTNGSSHLWLPQRADFYMDLNGHHFYNHHQLSNFLLFSVGVKQETQQPKLPKE
jgi:hypothetical protein